VLALYILVYLLLAVVAYHWIFEDWSIVDSIYFAVVMFTTIGYGDMSPSTQASQLFTIFFALYGIVILGLFLGIIGEVLVEAQQGAVKAVRERAQKRMMEMFSHENDARAAAAAAAAGAIHVLESEDDDTVKEEEQNVENHLCIDIYKALGRMAPILSFVVIAALLIGHAEGWTIITSLYYCVITATTVGFGDEAPQKEWVRLVAIFFMPVAVAVFGEVLGRIAQIYMDRSTQQAEKQFLQRELTLSDIAIMDTDGDGEVSLAEFLSFMLVAMQKVDKESIDDLKNLFQSLDADNSGSLQKEDLLILASRNKQTTSMPTSSP
jgi:potassium channel subfamily K